MSDNTAVLATARRQDPRAAAAVELLDWLGKNIPVETDSFGTYVDTRKLADWSGPWSGGERRVVAVALSLLGAGTVDLYDVIGGLGGEHRAAVVRAIVAAAQ